MGEFVPVWNNGVVIYPWHRRRRCPTVVRDPPAGGDRRRTPSPATSSGRHLWQERGTHFRARRAHGESSGW